MMYNRSRMSKEWVIPTDNKLRSLKSNWFGLPQEKSSQSRSIAVLDEWFKSTKFNYLENWDSMPYVDLTMGCGHFIESFVLGQHGLDNFQILPDEYAYYSFLGKWGTPAGSLEPNKPLIITLPHYKWGDLRPEWDDVIAECEQKDIDIHIDLAWLTLARDINIDLGHPAIRSIGLGLSKFDCSWNRVGLRYTKQRKLDSITIFNKFYSLPVNENLYSAGVYIANNLSRDYMWDTYETKNQEICNGLGLKRTKLIHGGYDQESDSVVCFSNFI